MKLGQVLFIAGALVSMMGVGGAIANEDIRVVIQAEPIDLDPCTIGHPFNGFVTGQNVIETLTTLDPDTGDIVPKLATSWETLGPGAWRFELRQGVNFHDGTPFDAATVETAIIRLQEAEFTCSGIINKLDKFDIDITVVDAHIIELASTDAPLPLPSYLAHVGIGAGSTPKSELERAPVGTGPYRFDDWAGGESITLLRFDEYWGEIPVVDGVTYVFRQEANLRALMVEAGEVDIAVHIAPQDATNPRIDFSYSNMETTRVRMVMQPPLDDIRVRRALNLAFDRQALIGTVLSDSVVPATQFISPSVNGYNRDLTVWDYDPDEARRLLMEAAADGVPINAELRLIAHPTIFANVGEVLQVMAQMWNDAGLNVSVEIMERAQWRALVNKPYDADRPAMLIQEQHDNTEGDAVTTMRFRYHTDGGQSEFSDAEVDALIELAEQSAGDVRREAFEEANWIIAEDLVPAVPMYHMVNYMRVSERLDYVPGGFYSAALLPIAKVQFATP